MVTRLPKGVSKASSELVPDFSCVHKWQTRNIHSSVTPSTVYRHIVYETVVTRRCGVGRRERVLDESAERAAILEDSGSPIETGSGWDTSFWPIATVERASVSEEGHARWLSFANVRSEQITFGGV